MIENLTRTLPEHRHPALRVELDLLDRAIAQQHRFDEDIALARIPDSQGLGGAALPGYHSTRPGEVLVGNHLNGLIADHSAGPGLSDRA